MQQLKKGDHTAFTEIYNRYHKQIYRYLISLVKSPQLAEDLVHEVFLKLWNAREKLDIQNNFASYLFRICHNQAYDATLKIARERHLLEELILHYPAQTNQHHQSPSSLHQLDALVDQALDTLTPQGRRVYDLCRRQGKTYQQTATELGISVHTVKDHMTKALATLRLFLQDRERLALIICLSEIIFKK